MVGLVTIAFRLFRPFGPPAFLAVVKQEVKEGVWRQPDFLGRLPCFAGSKNHQMLPFLRLLPHLAATPGFIGFSTAAKKLQTGSIARSHISTQNYSLLAGKSK